jgi:hypothetical protein
MIGFIYLFHAHTFVCRLYNRNETFIELVHVCTMQSYYKIYILTIDKASINGKILMQQKLSKTTLTFVYKIFFLFENIP